MAASAAAASSAITITFPLLQSKSPKFVNPSTSFSQRDYHANRFWELKNHSHSHTQRRRRRREIFVCALPLGVDPWAPTIDSQSIAPQLFALSLFPYIAFLYFITKSKTAPKLTLFGFYFLLAFVGATIPAGIYAKVHYGTSLSNVDWLHGGAESLLTLTNLFIVLGLREGLRKAENPAPKKSLKEEGEEEMKV